MRRPARILALVLFLLMFFGGPSLVRFYTDWLWFQEVGFASVFSTTWTTRAVLGIITFLLVWGFGGTPGLFIGCLVALATLGYQAYCVRHLGGITADVLGATNEVNESLVLLLITMVY